MTRVADGPPRSGPSPLDPTARAWLADTTIEAAVLALRPDYVALLVVAHGLQPGPSDPASDALLKQAEGRAGAVLRGRAPEELEHVAQWREAYRAFGAKPTRTRPSVEALLRRLDGGLPRVHRITDLYNAVSVAHLLPVGGEDLDRYTGTARLVRAHGSEIFDTASDGQPVREHPEPGEVVWRDDTAVTCRRWNWRQCTRTRISGTTTAPCSSSTPWARSVPTGCTPPGASSPTRTRQHPHAQIASRLIGSTS